MLHWSPKLIDDCSDTEDCGSCNNFDRSSEYTVFDHKLDSGWMSGKRRPVLYIPSLRSDQEIFDFMLEDVAMPSVSFSEEQEFEKTILPKDYNSNILTESAEAASMDTDDLEEEQPVTSVPVCASEPGSAKEEAPGKAKRQRCDDFPRQSIRDTFPLELDRQKLEFASPTSSEHTLVLCSSSGSTVDSFAASSDSDALFLNGNSDLHQLSVSPTDQFSDKENLDVIENPPDSEDPYDMRNLHDCLPKLKVMTPAHLHNEISGAFMSYSEMEASKSAWQVPTSHDSLDSGGTTAGESEQDTSFCSVDSTMTISSVESLPKVFYDPELHSGRHLTAVSVPPLRRGLALAAANCDQTVLSSGASYICDKSRSTLSESKIETRSCVRNGMVGFSVASRLRTPEPNTSYATSFSTSSKSRFSRRPEQALSKAMVKLVFPSPTKSASLNSFAVENRRTNGFMEVYSQTYRKRLRSLKTASTVEDLDYKRRCQRSTTPQVGNFKTELHNEHKNNENHGKTDQLHVQLSCEHSATFPHQQTSAIPRDHRLGISGATPVHSRMSVQSSKSVSGRPFAHRPAHRRSLFSVQPNRQSMSSWDNGHSVSQSVEMSGPSHDVLTNESTGSGELESFCRAKKRPILGPGKVDSKRALTLSLPLGKRNPLLQKFFDNIPAVTATNVMQFSDDQLEAVTLKNTLLNRGPSAKPSNATMTTQQTTLSAKPPSRIKWRADLVTMVTEGSKVAVTTPTARARRSILSVKSCDIKTSSVAQVSETQEL